MTTLGHATLCLSCEHLDRMTFAPGEDPVCTAYPAGIPKEIVYGGADHTELRGDEEAPVKHELQSGYQAVYDLWRDNAERLPTEEK